MAKLISSVTPQPLFKLFTTYAKGTFIPVESGRTVTSLPVRQTYYWPTSEGKPAKAPILWDRCRCCGLSRLA